MKTSLTRALTRRVCAGAGGGVGAERVADVAVILLSGAPLEAQPQTGEVTWAPLVDPDDWEIDWNAGAQTVDAWIRAASPDPGAYTGIGDETSDFGASQHNSKKGMRELVPGALPADAKIAQMQGADFVDDVVGIRKERTERQGEEIMMENTKEKGEKEREREILKERRRGRKWGLDSDGQAPNRAARMPPRVRNSIKPVTFVG